MPYKDYYSEASILSRKNAQAKHLKKHPDAPAKNTRRWKDKMDSEMRRRYRLRKNYHLSRERHDQMLESQNYRCAFPNCGELITFRSAIDHDHGCCSNKGGSCGKCIRGILCDHHNIGLGFFEKRKLECLLDAYHYLRSQTLHTKTVQEPGVVTNLREEVK